MSLALMSVIALAAGPYPNLFLEDSEQRLCAPDSRVP
jgi:hypothetical protein